MRMVLDIGAKGVESLKANAIRKVGDNMVNLTPKIKLLLLREIKKGYDVTYTIDYKYNSFYNCISSSHKLTYWTQIENKKGKLVNKPTIFYFDNQIELLKYLVGDKNE